MSNSNSRPLPSPPPGTPPPAPKETFYTILGVPHTASDVELKKAYRSKALETHPDKWRGKEREGVEKFQKIREAYEVLSDPARRKAYDFRIRLIHPTHVRSNTSPSTTQPDAETIKMRRDREEWVKQQRASHDAHMASLRPQTENRSKKPEEKLKETYAAMVEEILAEMMLESEKKQPGSSPRPTRTFSTPTSPSAVRPNACEPPIPPTSPSRPTRTTSVPIPTFSSSGPSPSKSSRPLPQEPIAAR